MKKFYKIFIMLTLAFAIGLGGALFAYDKKDAKKEWVNVDVCVQKCEKAEDCISRKSDGGPNGRTACSERCFELCEDVAMEKGE